MATYKDIVGTAVRNNAGNIPTAETGQVFFDSTNLDFKYQFPNTLSSWRTTNNLNTARDAIAAGLGIQTAALVVGGSQTKTETEQYDGTSFTEVNDLNTGRKSAAGTGTTTAALASGGDTGPSGSGGHGVANVEVWSGSSWSETTDISTARQGLAGVGPSTASLVFGGYDNPDYNTQTEFWNGSSWTELGDLNTKRSSLGGSGTTYTAALGFGGTGPGNLAVTESFNGTSWT